MQSRLQTTIKMEKKVERFGSHAATVNECEKAIYKVVSANRAAYNFLVQRFCTQPDTEKKTLFTRQILQANERMANNGSQYIHLLIILVGRV